MKYIINNDISENRRANGLAGRKRVVNTNRQHTNCSQQLSTNTLAAKLERISAKKCSVNQRLTENLIKCNDFLSEMTILTIYCAYLLFYIVYIL